MTPDLATLLLMRLLLEVLIAFAFWALMRRYPAMGGPGWWSLGSVVSIAGSLALMARAGGMSPQMGAMAGLLMFVANAFAWVGLRSYLRWDLPLKFVGVSSAGLLVALLAASFRPQPAALLQMLYVGSGLMLSLLSLRDLVRVGLRRAPPEFRALTALSAFEALVLVSMLVWMAGHLSPLDEVAATFLMLFLMTKLVRVMIYGALV